MPSKCLNFEREEDINEFLNTLDEFGFKSFHDPISWTILIEGKVEYAGYSENGKFHIAIWDEDRKLSFMVDSYHNTISLMTPNKDKEFIVLKSVKAEYRGPYLAIEYWGQEGEEK